MKRNELGKQGFVHSLIFTLLIFIILTLFPELVECEQFGDISISLDEARQAVSNHGYTEISFTVVNNSFSKAHVVELFFPENVNNFRNSSVYLEKISRTMTIQPNSKLKFILYQPNYPVYGHSCKIKIDGKLQFKSIALWPVKFIHLNYYSNFPYCVLISQSISKDLNLRIKNPYKSKYKSKRRKYKKKKEAFFFYRNLRNLSDWNSNWLSLSKYDGIIIHKNDIERKPATAKIALQNYTRCGGIVIFCGFKGEQFFDDIASLDHNKVINDSVQFRVIEYGFGKIIEVPINYKKWSNNTKSQIRSSIKETNEALTHSMRVLEANNKLPVVKSMKLPIRGLYILLIVFVFLIGPINVVLLSRRNKRIWLLWTIPSISLVTTVLIILYSLFSEGWRGKINFATITILDQNVHNATTIGLVGYYTVLIPDKPLKFTEETELTVQNYADTKPERLTIDWSDGQSLVNGWLTSRIPEHFLVRKNEYRRERLLIRKTGNDALLITNGLGADIKQLILRLDNKEYVTKNISAGETIKLLRYNAAGNYESSRASIRNIFVDFKSAKYQMINIEKFFLSGNKYLKNGNYIAELKGSPFFPNNLGYTGQEKYQTIVFGVFKGNINED